MGRRAQMVQSKVIKEPYNNLNIDVISASPPYPSAPQWVLMDVSQDALNKGKVARPYSESNKFQPGKKLSNVHAVDPNHLQFVGNGYIVIAPDYVVE